MEVVNDNFDCMSYWKRGRRILVRLVTDSILRLFSMKYTSLGGRLSFFILSNVKIWVAQYMGVVVVIISNSS